MRWLTKSLDQMREFERALSAASKLIDHRPPPPTSLVLCYERVLVRGVPQTRWVMLREVVREVVREMLDEVLGRPPLLPGTRMPQRARQMRCVTVLQVGGEEAECGRQLTKH